MDLLHYFGAISSSDRVVIDHNRITGGGVTAGIDFALQVVTEIFGADQAKKIQLYLEYNSSPPFHASHPSIASTALVEFVCEQGAASHKQREEICKELCLKN